MWMNVTGYEGRVPGLNDNQWSGKLILRDYGDGELAALRQGNRAGVWRGPRRLCRSGLRSGTLVKRSNERERNPGTPLAKKICALLNKKRTVPKVMSVALIELIEMTATLNVMVSINSTNVMQTYWTASTWEYFWQPLPSRIFVIKQFFCKINFMFNFQKTWISGYLHYENTSSQKKSAH